MSKPDTSSRVCGDHPRSARDGFLRPSPNQVISLLLYFFVQQGLHRPLLKISVLPQMRHVVRFFWRCVLWGNLMIFPTLSSLGMDYLKGSIAEKDYKLKGYGMR